MIPFLNQTVIGDKHIFIFHTTIVAIYLLVLFSKKLYYRVTQNREFIVVPRLQIRSISGISMMTAMNIALIVTISLLSNQIMGVFFKVYPGARFLIENILIKLGGIMYGPLIGIFIGFTTDLLTVILTSSVLNYGYFFAAIMNGFFGGIVHILLKIKDDRKVKNAVAAIAIAFCSLFYVCYLLYNNSEGKTFVVRVFSLSVSMHWGFLFLIISLVTIACTSFLGLSVFSLNNLDNPKYKDRKWVKYFAERYLFSMLLCCNCFIYLLVDIASLPLFDIKLSALPYEQFLISRIITTVPSLVFFSYLIHYIYKLHLDIKEARKDKDSIESGLQPPKQVKKKTFLPKLMH